MSFLIDSICHLAPHCWTPQDQNNSIFFLLSTLFIFVFNFWQSPKIMRPSALLKIRMFSAPPDTPPSKKTPPKKQKKSRPGVPRHSELKTDGQLHFTRPDRHLILDASVSQLEAQRPQKTFPATPWRPASAHTPPSHSEPWTATDRDRPRSCCCCCTELVPVITRH